MRHLPEEVWQPRSSRSYARTHSSPACTGWVLPSLSPPCRPFRDKIERESNPQHSAIQAVARPKTSVLITDRILVWCLCFKYIYTHKTPSSRSYSGPWFPVDSVGLIRGRAVTDESVQWQKENIWILNEVDLNPDIQGTPYSHTCETSTNKTDKLQLIMKGWHI